MSDEKVFYKVYQDFEAVSEEIKPDYYVETMENIQTNLSTWVDSFTEFGYAMPLFEPVLMTQEEFDKLPEFQGY